MEALESLEAAPPQRRSRTRVRPSLLILVSAGLYLLLCFTVFHGVRRANGGHFLFSLDDPYIHMALSEQIAHGTYGINPGEPASPSSSILWPWLLVPFANSPAQPLIALGFNLFAGLATAVLIGLSVARWPMPPAGSRRSPRADLFLRVLAAGALVVIANLVGLTFTGMEHTLQVFFAGVSAWAIVSALRDHRIPTWCLVVTAIGPCVRYENLGLSLAVAIALVGLRRQRAAVVLMTASLLPLVAFAVFLHHLGLPPLPSSVLIKGHVVGQHSGPVEILVRLVVSLIVDFWIAERFSIASLCVGLVILARQQRDRAGRFALFGAALALALQSLVGPFGWFFRYEVYALFFAVLIVLHVLHEGHRRVAFGWYILGLAWCAAPYVKAITQTVAATHEIYLQQFQDQRFLHAFPGNIAVNDLGLASYRRPASQQVLDLEGLGSIESASQKNKTPAWLGAITARHQVGLVVMYDEWYSGAPADWSRLGTVCLPRKTVAVSRRCVAFYATPLAPPSTQASFDAFTRTLPHELIVYPGNKPPAHL